MTLNRKNITELIFLGLFISTGLVPIYGALDRIATQWFYLSVINTLGLIYVLYENNNNLVFKKAIQFKPFIFLIGFIVWGLISYLYALNQDEVIIKTIRWIQLPLSLFILMTFFQSNYLDYVKVISIVVSIILLFELYFTYSTYFQLTQFKPYDFSYAYILRGATGNKNINAASLLIKTPFLIYLISQFKNHILKYLLTIVLASTIYLVFIISSRSSIISIFIILMILIMTNI